MRTLLVLLCLAAVPVWADEAADRDAIEKVVVVFNDGLPHADLFAEGTDAQREFRHIESLRYAWVGPWKGGTLVGPWVVEISHEPWGEARIQRQGSPFPRTVDLHLKLHSIRFVTADVAVVDAVNQPDPASLPARRALFVMKREGTVWRVAAVRAVTS